MTKLVLHGVSKSIAGHSLFEDVSFTLESGDKLAVVGPNGSGKSTLLKLISGEERPDAGRIDISPAQLGVGLCVQDIGAEELSRTLLDWVLEALPSWSDLWHRWQEAQQAGDTHVLEQLAEEQSKLEALYGYHPESRARAILRGLGFDEAKEGEPLSRLSGGWRERAKLAKALVMGSDVLLLDEPTNHLDLEALAWLEQFMLEFKGVVVFVAHERTFLDRITSKLLFISPQSRPLLYNGNFTGFLAWRQEVEKATKRQLDKLNRQIEHKQQFVDRFRYKASKASLAQSRIKEIEALEAKKQELELPRHYRGLSFQWLEPERSGDVVLNARDVEFAYKGSKPLWPPLTFTLYRGQKIGLIGPNGCGKSTLLRLIYGGMIPQAGEIRLGSNVKPAFFTQHMSDTLREGATVMEEMRRLCRNRKKEEEMRSALGLFLLGEPFWERKVAQLSGGERSRLMLASLFISGANLLILDEPTNNLDLESREALVLALEKFGGTVLTVAHDRYLLRQATEELYRLSGSGLERVGYEVLQSGRPGSASSSAGAREERSSGRPDRRKEQKRREAKERNELYRELRPKQERYRALEEDLERTLREQEEVEQRLADPAFYESREDVAAENRRYQTLQEQSDAILQEMEELEEAIQRLQGSSRATGAFPP